MVVGIRDFVEEPGTVTSRRLVLASRDMCSDRPLHNRAHVPPLAGRRQPITDARGSAWPRTCIAGWMIWPPPEIGQQAAALADTHLRRHAAA